MSLPQYNANRNHIKTVRFYYVGTGTLRVGQVLAFQENASLPATDVPVHEELGVAVEDLTDDNETFFAGIVPGHEAGTSGPRYVDLIVPQSGDVVLAEVDGTADVAVGDLLEPDASEDALVKGTAAVGESLFRALQARSADSAAPILVYRV